ncbi:MULTISPECIES: MBL fold metallo-hydrolase [Halobacterium]|nr:MULTISPECIES: MBL fold metallo-hydrolase [Halobacterium]MCF2166353.1 MBL fold metallo-hydrolase [Halobacterium salinarum]MCF2168140.1 MBL fold metallo-hydrolase [Halobacterium salinarum]MCF2206909.1 MBL fold metallo-hydrolase [Halobacterium salinarum]MCF2237807.1 MBL fold metallo-hydrolase [Halobacterium salinarum]MDL0120855.1 MBL fold metallo-hydrolase [Halobacterium salinarum]
MVHSDWGDWLPAAVAAADPDGIAVWYLGCNGVILKASDGTTLFVDPYLGTGDPPRTVRMIPVPFDPRDVSDADAVLATHEHTDHVHGPSQAPLLADTGCSLYAPEASIAVARDDERWQDDYAVTTDQYRRVAVGDTYDIGSFTVHVTPAHDPDAVQPVSYVFEHDAGTVFHGGDTKPADALAEIGAAHDIDVGILAFGSTGEIPDKQTREPSVTTWYNTETEVVACANALQLDRLVPTHWDMWKGLTADPTALHAHTRSMASPQRLDVVEIGDRIDVS